jgi:hypothetical protein
MLEYSPQAEDEVSAIVESKNLATNETASACLFQQSGRRHEPFSV